MNEGVCGAGDKEMEQNIGATGLAVKSSTTTPMRGGGGYNKRKSKEARIYKRKRGKQKRK